ALSRSGAVGTLVSQLVDFAIPAGQVDNVNDPDAGALLGIAVTAVDSANGSWWFSIDGGISWNAMGAASDANARLLAADSDTRIYFQPNADWNGTLANAITFRAWDRTSGGNGLTTDTTSSTSTLLDQFTAAAYSNSNGTASWTTPWVESDAAGGGATGGNILIAGGQAQFITNNVADSIYREANLSSATGATLTFDYNNTLAGSDRIDIQVSGNGGATWTTLGTFSSASNPGSGSKSYDISSFIAGNTRIRFQEIARSGSSTLFFDNVQITAVAAKSGGSKAFSSDKDSAALVVNPVNDPPVITSNGGGPNAAVNVAENTTAVTTVTSTDVDGGAPTYTILAGDDAVKFNIHPVTGALSFVVPPDFENPTDVGLDNVYNLTVQVSDGTGINDTDAQAIAVTVTNVADGIRVTPVSVGPLGGETRVNTTVADVQSIQASVSQAMAADANGNFVVVWVSNLQDGALNGIYARRFSADGTPQGGEFLVNTTTADTQVLPSVAMDAAGNFAIVWSSNNQDGSGYGVYGQRYNAAGVAQGGEFLVNTTTAGSQIGSGIAMSATGAFVVTWSGGAQDPDGSTGIYAQRFDAAGVAQGGEFRVNTYTTGTQQLASASMDANGNFVITWASNLQDGSGYGVYGQRFNASGVAQGAEFQVNTTTANSQRYQDVAMLPDGRFVVVFQSNNGDGTFEVYLQRYAADGSTIGGETQVNTSTVSAAQQPIPSISADADGNITVVWNSAADGSGVGVFARRFDWSGAPLGGEFQVNTTSAGDQVWPEVVAQAGGRFVVAWGGNGTGDADGVFFQRYGLATTEAGGTATFRVVLELAPTGDVVIPISVPDATEGTVPVGSLTFTPLNWNIAQTVTVTGVNDFVNDGDIAHAVIIGPAVSGDLNFSGVNPADLTVTNLDDDTRTLSGTVFEDVDGDSNVAEPGTLAISGATVRLYLDNGNGTPDAGDTFITTTTTNGSGQYSFTVADGTYWVTVDSKTIVPGPG
ncbi:MAG: cadherin repeat domain-containing protein, partial [Chthoniobacteraceae bacterium]